MGAEKGQLIRFDGLRRSKLRRSGPLPSSLNGAKIAEGAQKCRFCLGGIRPQPHPCGTGHGEADQLRRDLPREGGRVSGACAGAVILCGRRLCQHIRRRRACYGLFCAVMSCNGLLRCCGIVYSHTYKRQTSAIIANWREAGKAGRKKAPRPYSTGAGVICCC